MRVLHLNQMIVHHSNVCQLLIKWVSLIWEPYIANSAQFTTQTRDLKTKTTGGTGPDQARENRNDQSGPGPRKIPKHRTGMYQQFLESRTDSDRSVPGSLTLTNQFL